MTDKVKATMDLDVVKDFTEFLTSGVKRPINIQVFPDNKELANKIKAGKSSKVAWHKYGVLDDKMRDKLLKAEKNGCGIYAVINETDKYGRKASNVTGLRFIFVDGDGVVMPKDGEWAIQPHMICVREDDPTRWHAYWIIRNNNGSIFDGQNESYLRAWKGLQLRAALYYGTDQKIIDPSRVMRIPGTLHQKEKGNTTKYIIRYYDREKCTPIKFRDFMFAHKLTEDQGARVKRMQWGKRVGSYVGIDDYDDNDQSIERYAEMLEKHCAVSVEGDAGNAHAYTVAARGRDLGLSPDMALEVMLDHWNDRCEPPFAVEELQVLVENAYNYAQSPIGWNTPQAVFSETSEKHTDIDSVKNPHHDAEQEWLRSYSAPIKGKPPLVDWYKTLEEHATNDTPRNYDTPSIFQKNIDANNELIEDGWEDSLTRTTTGVLKLDTPNGFRFLKHLPGLKGLFGYNEFFNSPMLVRKPPWSRPGEFDHVNGVPIDHADATRTTMRICTSYGENFPLQSKSMMEAIVCAAHDNLFNPVKDYLEGLKWDGVSRIDTWLHDFIGCKQDEYTRAIGAKFLMAMVKRVLQPGCKFDHMLILEGEQGEGKSELFKTLAGWRYFSESPPDLGTKDFMIHLQGKWLVELAELNIIHKASVNTAKSVITTTHDKFRPPYGLVDKEFARQGLLVGTTNQFKYLLDETGNRRYWPVRVVFKRLDIKGLSATRDQLFAEAYMRVINDVEPLYLVGEAAEIAKVMQLERHDSDVWEDVFLEALETKEKESGIAITKLSTKGVWLLINPSSLNFATCAQKDKRRIGQIMRKLGWDNKQLKLEGKNVRGYERM